MRRLLFILLSALQLLNYSAQQLSFENKVNRQQPEGYFWSYEQSPSTVIKIDNAQYYKSKKIKNINIYSKWNKLLYTLELDTTGNISRSGYDMGDFFKVYWSSGSNPQFESQTCLQKDKVVKTDSSTRTHFQYLNGDTVMTFIQIKRQAYLNGSLLNLRNTDYNKRFLHKRYRLHNCEHTTYINKFGKRWPVKRTIVYLKKRLRTNYHPDTLYFANASIYEQWESAVVGQKAMDTSILNKHPFFLRFHKQDKKTFFVDGEQPIRTIYCYFCRNSGPYCSRIYSGVRDYAPSFEHNEFTFNVNGLYDEYVSLYYPQDTSKAAIKKFKEQQAEKNDQNKNAVKLSGYDDSNLYPRSETPIIKRIFYFRYTYYED